MITRDAEQTITTVLKGFPIVTVTGPRQSGKTTLARMGLFILTGSQQFGLLSGISQSLAGRTAFVAFKLVCEKHLQRFRQDR